MIAGGPARYHRGVSSSPFRENAGCLLLFAVPFALAGAMLAFFKLHDLERTREVMAPGVGTSWRGPDGPVLLEGKLSADDGAAQGGQIAWASALKLRREKSTRTICQEQHLTALSLVLAGGERVSLGGLFEPPKNGPAVVDWSTGTFNDSLHHVRIDAGVTSTFRPDALGEGSPPAVPLPCPYERGGYYDFHILHEGEPVKVLACKRGNALVPCDESCHEGAACSSGGSRIFSGKLSRFLDLSLPPAFFEFWLSFALGMVFVFLSAYLPPLVSDEKEAP